MPYTFRLIFGGLCALVPRKDDHKLDILVVNTQHSRAAKLNHQPLPHVARLEFDLADLAGGSGAHDVSFGVWRLNFEDLAISAKSTSAPLTFVGDLNELKSGSPGDNLDFSWIPKLKLICPEAGRVEADCYADHPQTDPQKGFIKGRLTLDKGVAKVNEFSRYLGPVVIAEFVPKPDGCSAARAAMPHLADVAIEVEDGEMVTITRTSFDGKASASLNFGPAKTGDEIKVHLTNLCCGGYQDEDLDVPPKEDDDFEGFYILCDNFDTLRGDLRQLPLPVPVEYATKTDITAPAAGGGHPIECSMARMER